MKPLVLTLPLFVSLAACGGALDSDLFADASPSTHDASSVDATKVDAGDPPQDGGVVDATPIVDAKPSIDATPVVDAGPADPGTLCMTQPQSSYCKNESELCCVKQTGTSCIAANLANTCNPGTRIFCDNSDSCKLGEVCCGNVQSFNNQNFYTEVKCASQCNVTATQIPGQRRFCNPDAKLDECVSYGLTCKPSGLLAGYSVCSN
ncbi:hypothetical protein BH09MYX1_BH09MYX1_51190 [soil metagenome]